VRALQMLSVVLVVPFLGCIPPGGGNGGTGAATPGPTGGAAANGPAATGTGAGAADEFLLVGLNEGGRVRTHLFDVTTATEIALPGLNQPGTDVVPIDMSADARFLLCAWVGAAPVLYDRSAGLSVQLSTGGATAITPDGRYVLYADGQIYDRLQGAVTGGFLLGSGAADAMSADARRCATGGGWDASVVEPYVSPGAPALFDGQRDLGLDDDGDGHFLTGDGRYLYFQSGGLIVLADVNAKQAVPLPGINATPGGYSTGVTFLVDDVSPDGRFVLVSSNGQGGPFSATSQIALYDAASAVAAYVPLPGFGESVLDRTGAWIDWRCRTSGDGRYIAGAWRTSATAPLAVHVYDRTGGGFVALPLPANSGLGGAGIGTLVLRP
jgi:hypothetical protein